MSLENPNSPAKFGSPEPTAPWPPEYYAVIFSSQMTGQSPEEYQATAERMETLAKSMPGYLGIESARNPGGDGITISYWKSLEDIKTWKQQAEHSQAQKKGRATWYSDYRVRVCKVERDYRKNPPQE